MFDPELFLEFLIKRRTIRKYQDKPISDKDLKMILEAGRWSPSASNKQPWEFIVIKNTEILQKIGKTGVYGLPLRKAPMGIAIVGKKDENPDWYVQDTTLASMNMMLMGWTLNIGMCWIGSMDREFAKKILGLGENDFLLTILPMGYIKGKIPKPTLRKDLDDIFRIIT
ncbi:MAG: nitroreductase family protein [Promethearchaeota archaeon]|nr:MAG: nitroreductase family protein [Candidatus Lokiarchaeota archaeon]